ncbi:MAG: IS21 family transposase, partial [Actinobacteria bacterium]|nr:IS21 family transposase [Actinomycetota bacterium]
GKSKSWIARELGISRNTVRKYLKECEAPKYRATQPRGKPVSDKWKEHVRLILEDDRNAPRKQKHTAKRIFERLVEEHQYAGSYRTVRKIVADIKNKPGKAVFLPLQYEPGKDAQVDFGESYADIDGERTKVHIFEMRLNYSRKKFVMAVRAANMESFMEAHVRAFEFFQGVPERLTYDNLGLAVVRVGKGKDRTLTKKFKELMGFYSFESNFCTVGLEGAHEKGGVEGGIGFSRRNWLVPVPRVERIEELNEKLLKRCIADGERIVDGTKERIAQAFEREQRSLLTLPERSFDAGTARHCVIADSYQTVGYDSNRYSVPQKFVGIPLRVRAYLDKIVLSTNLEVIAEHERSYKKNDYCLHAEHYLDQLERKPHAVPFAKPLLQTEWPAGYWNFYERLVEQKGASEGGKDYVRVLRCHMQHGAALTGKAVLDCAAVGLISADAILQVVAQARFASRTEVTPLDMTERPALREYSVKLEETAKYQILLGEHVNEHSIA